MAPALADSLLKWGTFSLALWGAGLSTVLGIRTLWGDRRRLKVTCSGAIAALPSGTADFVVITAVNVGKRLVEVRTAELLMNNGNKFLQPTSRMGPQPFGRKLADGESVSFHFDLDEVGKAVSALAPGERFVKAIVTDAEGRRHSTNLRGGMKKALRPRSPAKPPA